MKKYCCTIEFSDGDKSKQVFDYDTEQMWGKRPVLSKKLCAKVSFAYEGKCFGSFEIGESNEVVYQTIDSFFLNLTRKQKLSAL